MTINDLRSGAKAKVVSVDSAARSSRRLMELGVVPGVSVEFVKAAPFGDPIEVRIRGYSLALRRNEADAIKVETEEQRTDS